MTETLLFCAVFTSQLLVITLYLARRATANLRYVLRHCPPATHPSLYPQPRAHYERLLHNFTTLNAAVGIAALCVVVAMLIATLRGGWDGALILPWSASGEWDAAILVPFFLLQMVPFIYFDVSMGRHYKALASLSPPRQRTAALQRRRLQDFISPAMLGATVLVNVAFIVFVLDYRRHGFAWFTAAGNIVAVAAAGLVLLATLSWALYGRKLDHFETDQDRVRRIKRAVIAIWLIGIVMPVLITVQLLQKAFAPGVPDFLFVSFYVTAIALVSRWSALKASPEQIDFDVYRQDAGARS